MGLGSHPFNADWAAEGVSAGDLLAAADEHRQMMVPAPEDTRRKTLRGLRSATILRNEEEEEAVASYQMLVVHLADVPTDILQEACRRYVNMPGVRFFPRSAGELRQFTAPLMTTRAMREWRLRRMAEAAEARDRRDREAADFEWTIDQVRALPRFAAALLLRSGTIGQDIFDEAFPADAEATVESEGQS